MLLGVAIYCLIDIYWDRIKWFFTLPHIKRRILEKRKKDDEERKYKQAWTYLNEPAIDNETGKMTSLWERGCREFNGIKFDN